MDNNTTQSSGEKTCASCEGPCRCGRKKFWMVVVIIAVVLVGWWMLSRPAAAPQNPAGSETQTSNLPAGDSVVEVNQILDSVDTGDLDAEFQAIDADLNNL